MNLYEQLKAHEGFRATPYLDTTGHWTVGYGRNLEARPFTQAEAERWLAGEVDDLVDALSANLSWFDGLDDVRKAALVNMAYNLGLAGLFRFRRMLQAIHLGEFQRAAHEALDSKWATQVKRRAKDIAFMLETGNWP